MNPAEKFKIRSNEKLLQDNLTVENVMPLLFQGMVLTDDDVQRIKKESTRCDKVYKLLRILETCPKGYTKFINILNLIDMSFIADEIESTVVDEETLRIGRPLTHNGYLMFLLFSVNKEHATNNSISQ